MQGSSSEVFPLEGCGLRGPIFFPQRVGKTSVDSAFHGRSRLMTWKFLSKPGGFPPPPPKKKRQVGIPT